jgi:hypothetical protein
MKRIIINSLAFVGACSITLALLDFGVTIIAPPGPLEQTRSQFGSPEGIRAISELYSRIERSPKSPDLKIVKETWLPVPQVATIRVVPRSWLSDHFKPWWGTSDDIEHLRWGAVLAYYGQNDELIGIEFLGSRYGCFASRDPERCPSWFVTLNRLAEKPLWITGCVTGEE